MLLIMPKSVKISDRHNHTLYTAIYFKVNDFTSLHTLLLNEGYVLSK